MEIGIALSSEERSPLELVETAQAAEEAGLESGLISDHIHPWVDVQGHSGFVWSVLSAIRQQTERFRIGIGVTCALIRIHPAIVAHAAATVVCLMPGRFFLGVGTGENLNEHVHGAKLPAPDELEGAIPLGPDADEYLTQIKESDQVGYTHLAIHQIGPDQEGFLAFAQNELLARV